MREDYIEYSDTWMPKGIIPLNKKDRSCRNAHYRFEYSQCKLRRVVYANSTGTPQEQGDTERKERSSILILHHPVSESAIPAIERQTSQGIVILTEQVGGRNFDRIDLKSNDRASGSAAIIFATTAMEKSIYSAKSQKAEIRRYVLTRDKKGFVIRKEFKRHNGEDNPACDAEGIYGFDYKIDSLGRPIEIYFLGYQNEHTVNKKGVACKKYQYDSFGNITRCEYSDTKSKLVLNNHLWAVAVYTTDQRTGNIISESYYDIDEKPCLRIDCIAKMEMKYDDRGNMIESSYFQQRLRTLPTSQKLCYNDSKI